MSQHAREQDWPVASILDGKRPSIFLGLPLQREPKGSRDRECEVRNVSVSQLIKIITK